MKDTIIKVRYCETDRMGIVHHSRYYPWFEVARDEFMTDMGICYRDLENQGLYLPLIETHSKYIKPATYGDTVIIKCSLIKLSVVKCTFEYEVYRESDNELLNIGRTLHAFCDHDMKPISLKKKFPDTYELLTHILKKEE
ncbi:MAG: thioesterase family protein [Clostridia bacterium]|nr:thioesterase family protein [Clostridia bacterium]